VRSTPWCRSGSLAGTPTRRGRPPGQLSGRHYGRGYGDRDRRLDRGRLGRCARPSRLSGGHLRHRRRCRARPVTYAGRQLPGRPARTTRRGSFDPCRAATEDTARSPSRPTWRHGRSAGSLLLSGGNGGRPAR
jgi:hypothetical protein